MADVKTSAETDGAPAQLTDIVRAVRPGSPNTNVRLTLEDVLALGGGTDEQQATIGFQSLGANWKLVSDIHLWGDSVTAATGGTSYSTPLTTRSGMAGTNHAVSGDQAADQSEVAHGLSVSEAQLHTLMVGLNDARQYGNDIDKLAAFKAAHAELVAWLAIPAAGKVTARNAAITYVGTWANDANNGNIAKKSSTVGDTASFSANGRTIYIGARLANGNSDSDFTVKVDGVLQGMFSCDAVATITTQNAQTYCSQLIRIDDLDEGDHAIEIEVVGSGGTVYLEWVSALTGQVAPTWPRVLVGNIYKLNGTGYATAPANASDAVIGLYNKAIRKNLQQLANDGLLIGVVDIGRLWDAGSELSGDGIHPNSTGYGYLADTFFGMLVNVRLTAEVDITMNSTWAAYTVGMEPRARIKDGIVFLHGIAKKNGSGSTTIGNVPAPFRPMGQDRYPPCRFDLGTGSPASGGLQIKTNGDIVFDGSLPSDNVSMDGVSWPVTKSLA